MRATELSEAINRQMDGRFELLLSAIESLAPQQRKVFELAKLDDRSHEEIRTETGLSINSIKHYAARAKALLIRALTGREP